MNRVHNYQVIQVITLIIMVLVMFLIVFINSSSESIAVAENVSTMAAEEESAMLTESDDIAGYAGKTIRDYGIDESTFLSRLDDMVEQAFDDQCTGANPRYPLMSEIKQMYLNAYYGNHKEV